MTLEDLRHLCAVGRTTTGGTDHFSGFAEVRGSHDRRGYEDELFHILVAKVIEAMHRTSRDAQRLPGTNLDGRAFNCPGKNSLDTVKNLLVGVVLVGRSRQFLPLRDTKLKHRHAAVGIITRKEKPDLYCTDLDGFFRRIDTRETLIKLSLSTGSAGKVTPA